MVAIVKAAGTSEVNIDFPSDVRAVVSLQDQAGAGSIGAIAMQKVLLSQINARYLAMAKEILPTSKNVDAVIGYVLSGGHPALAEAIARSEQLDATTVRLLEGVAFFARGDRVKARERLQEVDPLTLPPTASGRLALVRAMLLPDGDPLKFEFLEIAAATMPGTLVEESALRRASLAAVSSGEVNVFWGKMDRYFRRFNSSPWAAEFSTAAMVQLVKRHKAGMELDRARLERLLDRFPASRRLLVYLLVSRTAIREGLPEIAVFAARRARRLSLEGSTERLQAELYDLAYGVIDDDPAGVRVRLSEIDASRLPSADQLLLAAALKVVAEIEAGTTISPLRNSDGGDEETGDPLEGQVRATMAAADVVLERGSKQ
ncbi:MAG: hypothetical protein KDK89_10320 [Alphaproteobacteria bacterium]|nr:hypothetical protein [Alphaproteobacteria bacterium]